MSDRILVVDDENSILDILTQLLRPLGYDCEATTSPIQALELIDAESFALLLTDVKMPEMNGIEVVRRAKEIDPNLSIIIVTALMDISHAIQAIRLGADDYVLKPFNLRDITEAVTRAMDERSAQMETIDYQGKLEARVSSATTDLEDVNSQLRAATQYLENLLDSTVDAIITATNAGKIEYVNGGALAMLGYDNGHLLGAELDEVFTGDHNEFNQIQEILERERTIKNYETMLRHREGHDVHVSVSLSQVPDADGEPVAILAICKDTTEQKRLQHELREMSLRDGLTGLYNQRYFHEVIDREVERAHRQGRPLSLLLFDVDGFKTYNDTRGHLEGDAVLQAVGSIVRECTREHVDAGFRYGGDEFTVILPEAGEPQATTIANRIRTSFEEKQFDSLTVSIGLVQFREGDTPRSFIRDADELMYEAKRAGGNRVNTRK
jgi:diguanylate cyclase (GGDEF)-like protein/PAS domain S-box-containing protein